MFDFMNPLKKSVTELRERNQSLATRSEAVQRDRAMVAGAPPAKTDLKDFVANAIQREGREYRQRLENGLKSLRSLRINGSVDAPVVRTLIPQLLGLEVAGQASGASMQTVLCGVLTGELISALSEAIDAMPWEGEGLPSSDRRVRLERLDAELHVIEMERSQLAAKAAELGVSLT